MVHNVTIAKVFGALLALAVALPAWSQTCPCSSGQTVKSKSSTHRTHKSRRTAVNKAPSYYTARYVVHPDPLIVVRMAPDIAAPGPAAPVLQPPPCPGQRPLYYWNDQIF